MATRNPGYRGKPDQICADAVDLARAAVTEDIAGAHIEVVAEGERLVTHYFECLMSGYRGWRWAVTVARTSRSKIVTICETVLLPGPDALTTPDWVPWTDRVQPGDLGIGDLMPTAPDDDRLVPAYLMSDDPAVEDVVWELGLGRVRVLSRDGRLDTAERWYEGDAGPSAAISTGAPSNARCVSCGFFLPLAGSMRSLFGACANVYAPDDGRVVSGDHGCGAHSEVLIEQVVEVAEAPTIYDDAEVEPVARLADAQALENVAVPEDVVIDGSIPEVIPESDVVSDADLGSDSDRVSDSDSVLDQERVSDSAVVSDSSIVPDSDQAADSDNVSDSDRVPDSGIDSDSDSDSESVPGSAVAGREVAPEPTADPSGDPN